MIKRTWTLPLGVEGTVIDVETTSLSPQDGELLTVGFFEGKNIRILQREKKDGEGDFRKTIKDVFEHYSRPFYAYNAGFEEAWLNIKFDYDLMEKWRKECEKYVDNKGKRKKWPRLEELVSLPQSYFRVRVEARGSEVPGIWQRYFISEDTKELDLIIYHNLYDLIREACLAMWDETISDVIGEIIKQLGKEKRFL